jgi:hypothetical protein
VKLFRRERQDATPERFFFVHIMKTGGTTLFQHLTKNFTYGELYPNVELDVRYDGLFRQFEWKYLSDLPPERVKRIRVYVGHFPYVFTEMLGGDFTTMTLLRDPVERTVSMLKQLRRDVSWQGDSNPDRPDFSAMTFEGVYDDHFNQVALLGNHQTKIFSLTSDDAPKNFLHPLEVDDARLALAKQKLARIDVIGLNDLYDDFLAELRSRFGWELPAELRTNVAQQDEALAISPELHERIVADTAYDRELYEYAKELVASRAVRTR